MRRCLHACLVGVLVFALSMDAARACWFLRRGCGAGVPAWSACATPAPWWVDRAAAARCGDTIVVEVVADVVVEAAACDPWDAVPATVVIDDGIVSDDAGLAFEAVVVHDESAIVGETIEAHGDLVASDAEPTPSVEEVVAPPVTESQDAAEPAATSVVVPELKPAIDAPRDVQPASATQDEAMQPAAEPVVPAAPSEPNLFEEADRSADFDTAPAGGEPEADAPPATGAGEPPPEPAAAPTNPLDAAERRSGERARLWVDATGRHATVGVLVDVRADGRCVIDTGTGILEVRSEELRRRDRDYAAQAGERLAARRGPGPGETAGR